METEAFVEMVLNKRCECDDILLVCPKRSTTWVKNLDELIEAVEMHPCMSVYKVRRIGKAKDTTNLLRNSQPLAPCLDHTLGEVVVS